jgi:hypothetical protein
LPATPARKTCHELAPPSCFRQRQPLARRVALFRADVISSRADRMIEFNLLLDVASSDVDFTALRNSSSRRPSLLKPSKNRNGELKAKGVRRKEGTTRALNRP